MSVVQMTPAISSWPYQTSEVVMLPYSEKHLFLFPEDYLGRFYYRLRSENTLHKIFPGMGMNHLNTFLNYLPKRPGLVICCVKGEPRPRAVGFGWLTEVDGREGARKGAFGFGFFKEVWGRQVNIDLSYMMLHYWMSELKIDTLYGTTLKTNRLAVRYSQHFGFDFLCNLPRFWDVNGKAEDATLIVLLKEKFMPRYMRWRAEANGR